ncbi:MAG: hypothetical protein CL943_02085 [Candidatus Diapherotrites archaeon]|uniref:Uncharacterized protein n=1 Tax=Candidatus Iainarchaeum sp. TaxID=3101447 RepID=A0A2D6M0X5_9ARCH|nr:hypothetical protein [Candidatus Diapherotrites archaeon]|tara:strand:+ start:674 stop:1123 length:450 start_codon:yes stop_codon:yes gene_type:complete
MDSKIVLAILFGLLIGLLFAGTLYLVFSRATAPALASCPTPDFSCESGELPAEARKDFYWELVSLEKVEPVCLNQARAYAGENSFAVLGCDCTQEDAGADKAYDCVVSALDGDHPVKIDCIKDDEKCIIESEVGIVEFSFEELYQEIYG